MIWASFVVFCCSECSGLNIPSVAEIIWHPTFIMLLLVSREFCATRFNLRITFTNPSFWHMTLRHGKPFSECPSDAVSVIYQKNEFKDTALKFSNSNLSLFISRTHTGEVTWFHSFLASTRYEGQWWASRPDRFAPRETASVTNWIRSWVGPRARSGRFGEEMSLAPVRNRNTLPRSFIS